MTLTPERMDQLRPVFVEAVTQDAVARLSLQLADNITDLLLAALTSTKTEEVLHTPAMLELPQEEMEFMAGAIMQEVAVKAAGCSMVGFILGTTEEKAPLGVAVERVEKAHDFMQEFLLAAHARMRPQPFKHSVN